MELIGCPVDNQQPTYTLQHPRRTKTAVAVDFNILSTFFLGGLMKNGEIF
jgi:hypothetical protein